MMDFRFEESFSFRAPIMEKLAAKSYDDIFDPLAARFHPSPPAAAGRNGRSAAEMALRSNQSTESFIFCRTNSGSESSEQMDDQSYISDPSPSRWPSMKSGLHNQCLFGRLGLKELHHDGDDEKMTTLHAEDLELELMKERFAKLLLGEDMSGGGKGVCTAVTISNAITNLYATVFGQNLRLEPLKPEKKSMWRREITCLLSVTDYIVEFIPTLQTLHNGTVIETMTSKQRKDICINLPALKKLDAMLLELLDSFERTEFWYVESESMSSSSTRSGSFRRVVHHKEDKWWLPVPCVPSEGLSSSSKEQLMKKKRTASEIHKAAMSINGAILDEMEIPDSYILTLPKCGKSSVGDSIYKYMSSSGKFSPDNLLDRLKIGSEHEALDLADRIESSMYTWRRKSCQYLSKPSWALVKETVAESGRTEKNHNLAERAESLLFALKKRFPELSQTSLDICKIHYNQDVGLAVLESYSRVLEGLAFNIVAWIEDVLHVDTITVNQVD